MAVSTQRINLSGLAKKLVLDGLLDANAAQKHAQSALKANKTLVSYLVEEKLVGSDAIAIAASQEFGLPVIDINAVELDPDVTKLVKEDLMKKHHALPIYKHGNHLYVGVSDPTNIQGLDEIKFATGMRTDAIIVEENKLINTIDKVADEASTTFDDMGDADLDNLDDLEVGDDGPQEQDDADIDDAPVVRFVNKILLDAIKKGASDLHFEPYEKVYRVRFRVDGVLQEVAKPPLNLSAKIAARIKVMARLDVSERRVPQDGRIKLKLSKNKAMDFRVSTCPTLLAKSPVCASWIRMQRRYRSINWDMKIIKRNYF